MRDTKIKLLFELHIGITMIIIVNIYINTVYVYLFNF